MIKKLEEYLFGQVAGRVLARLAVSAAAWIVGQAAAKGVHMDPAEVSAAMIAGFNAAWTWLKDWRDRRAAAAQPGTVPLPPAAPAA